MCRGAGVGAVPPAGAAFTASWKPAIDSQHIPALWNGFTNAVAGVVCSSLTTLAPTAMHFTPQLPWAVWDAETPPTSEAAVLATLRGDNAAHTVTGMLSQEAVCTENLTGFVKLLPCRERAGIGRLLAPGTVLSSPYHTLDLTVREHNGVPPQAPVELTLKLETLSCFWCRSCIPCHTLDLTVRAPDIDNTPTARQNTCCIVIQAGVCCDFVPKRPSSLPIWLLRQPGCRAQGWPAKA